MLVSYLPRDGEIINSEHDPNLDNEELLKMYKSMTRYVHYYIQYDWDFLPRSTFKMFHIINQLYKTVSTTAWTRWTRFCTNLSARAESLFTWQTTVRKKSWRIKKRVCNKKTDLFLHISGEEATHIGSAAALSPDDLVFGQYREAGKVIRNYFYFRFLSFIIRGGEGVEYSPKNSGFLILINQCQC